MPKASAVPATSQGYPQAGLYGRIMHAIGRRILTGEIRPGEQNTGRAIVKLGR